MKIFNFVVRRRSALMPPPTRPSTRDRNEKAAIDLPLVADEDRTNYLSLYLSFIVPGIAGRWGA